MKQRYSSLDVRAICHELNSTLVGTRITNVYDLVPPATGTASAASSSRAILIRLGRNQDKFQLIVDSGLRCHLTAYDARAASKAGGGGGAGSAPSAFVARLRTFLNGRLLTGVSQVGADRVMELQFHDGQLRLYLEFFAAGNIVLTDAASKVLALQRTVGSFRSASLDTTLSVNSTYAIGAQHAAGTARPAPELSLESVRRVLEQAVAADAPKRGPDGKPLPAQPKKKKNKGFGRTLGMYFTDLSQVLIDHCMLTTGFDASNTEPAAILADEARLQAVLELLRVARDRVAAMTSTPMCPGVVIATKKEPNADADADADDAGATSDTERAGGAPPSGPNYDHLDFIDYHPFSPRQFETDDKYVVLHYESFNKTADEFYSALQGIKAHRQVHQRESVAAKKLESTKRDQEQRIQSLQEVQALNERKAAAIRANSEWVQAALDAVNDQLKTGIDWRQLGLLIEVNAPNDPVAAMFKLPLHLEQGVVTLVLDEEPEDWDDDEDDGGHEYGDAGAVAARPLLDVDVKIGLSAWANAREYFDQKRSAASKAQKTKEVSSLALRNAEKKVAEELRRTQAAATGSRPAVPHLIRKHQWFEKFTWFVSSDGYLVLAAKDPMQCEMLYRRYFAAGDVYVHADVKGSPGIIVIKNRADVGADGVIPPATLAQAGCLALCASEAWETKAGLGAYWVRADQVHKSTARGDILPHGVFDVRGEKNHMPPPQRVLGFGLMFKISEASKANHSKHLAVEGEWGERDDQDEAEQDEDERDEDEQDEKPERDEQDEMAEKTDDERDVKVPDLHVAKPTEEETPETKTSTEEPTPASEPPVEPTEETPAKIDTASERTSPRPAPKTKGNARQPPSPTLSHATTANTGTGVSKRTQKAKAKKMAKYKDQDEEDRQAAERLSGVAAGREKAEARAKALAQRQAEIAAYEERRRVQKEKQAQKIREFEAVRQAKLQESAADLSEALEVDSSDPDNGRLDVLTSIVGRPVPGDEILELIPVCAPWPALARLKYKVKLQPGQAKKGRAMREVLERWRRAGEPVNGKVNAGVVDVESRDPERIWPRETELLASMKMEEASNCVPVSKLTVVHGGGLGGAGAGGKGGKGGKGGNKGDKKGKKK